MQVLDRGVAPGAAELRIRDSIGRRSGRIAAVAPGSLGACVVDHVAHWRCLACFR